MWFKCQRRRRHQDLASQSQYHLQRRCRRSKLADRRLLLTAESMGATKPRNQMQMDRPTMSATQQRSQEPFLYKDFPKKFRREQIPHWAKSTYSSSYHSSLTILQAYSVCYTTSQPRVISIQGLPKEIQETREQISHWSKSPHSLSNHSSLTLLRV